MPGDKSEILQGTVDLMVLKTPDAMGPLPVYGVARPLNKSAKKLCRSIRAQFTLLRCAWYRSCAWGTQENNRKAKFYSITRPGRKLNTEARNWERVSTVIGCVLRIAERG
jgi:PadR family transcriptional regulator PadR